MYLKLLVTLVSLFIMSVNGEPCSRKESVDITGGESFVNGSILHNGLEYPSSAWYKVKEDNKTLLLGCPCINRVCLWKCCGHQMMLFNKTCTGTDRDEMNPFNPPVYKDTDKSGVDASQHFLYMYNKLCDARYIVDPTTEHEELYIQEDATLYQISKGKHHQRLSPTSYCADMMADGSAAEPRLVFVVCYPDEDTEAEEDSPALYVAYAIGLLLSVPFLLATFLVYAFVPELRNLHGLCLMAYCAGLIVAYPLLAYLKVNVGDVGIAKGSCLAMAFLIYYSFQTSFFWLNVMCFDIWRTFSGYRGGSSSKRRELRRFGLYGLYAWGLPLLLTAITAGLQFAKDLPPSIIRPNFGEKRCWFEDWQNELVYFFTPVLALVVCNVVLFSVTAHRIRAVHQETAILKGAESARSDKVKRDKQRYCLYLKLFIVMGVNWTVEVISFAAGGSNLYWVLIDLSNLALGVFIFFIFVWKENVRNLVRKRFARWRGGTAAESSGSRWATTHSSAPTELTRVSAEDPGAGTHQLKEMR